MTSNQKEVIYQDLTNARLLVEVSQNNYDIAEYKLDYAKSLLRFAEGKAKELDEKEGLT